MTNCPRCKARLARNEASWPGRVILGCRACRMFAVETKGRKAIWVEGGPGWLDRLKESVGGVETIDAILDSDDDDPRWERVW